MSLQPCLVLLVPLARRAQPALKASLVKRPHKVPPAQPVPRVSLALSVRQEQQVWLVLIQQFRVLPVLLVPPALKVLLARRAQPVRPVLSVL